MDGACRARYHRRNRFCQILFNIGWIFWDILDPFSSSGSGRELLRHHPNGGERLRLEQVRVEKEYRWRNVLLRHHRLQGPRTSWRDDMKRHKECQESEIEDTRLLLMHYERLRLWINLAVPLNPWDRMRNSLIVFWPTNLNPLAAGTLTMVLHAPVTLLSGGSSRCESIACRSGIAILVMSIGPWQARDTSESGKTQVAPPTSSWKRVPSRSSVDHVLQVFDVPVLCYDLKRLWNTGADECVIGNP